MANRIVLVGNGRNVEHTASAALTPGHLLELLSTNKVRKHSSAGGNAELMFAQEDALQGKDITDAYEADTPVNAYIGQPGDEIYAILKAGENVAIGDLLISGGDGTLIENGSEASGVTVKKIIAVALEAKNLSASGATAANLAVRLL